MWISYVLLGLGGVGNGEEWRDVLAVEKMSWMGCFRVGFFMGGLILGSLLYKDTGSGGFSQ